jgi:hypothetical protein
MRHYASQCHSTYVLDPFAVAVLARVIGAAGCLRFGICATAAINAGLLTINCEVGE